MEFILSITWIVVYWSVKHFLLLMWWFIQWGWPIIVLNWIVLTLYMLYAKSKRLQRLGLSIRYYMFILNPPRIKEQPLRKDIRA
jgi:hypothetical protein